MHEWGICRSVRMLAVCTWVLHVGYIDRLGNCGRALRRMPHCYFDWTWLTSPAHAGRVVLRPSLSSNCEQSRSIYVHDLKPSQA